MHRAQRDAGRPAGGGSRPAGPGLARPRTTLSLSLAPRPAGALARQPGAAVLCSCANSQPRGHKVAPNAAGAFARQPGELVVIDNAVHTLTHVLRS
jgi:hypothetical protein